MESEGSSVSYDDIKKLIDDQDILFKNKTISNSNDEFNNNIINNLKTNVKQGDINKRKALYEFQQVEKLKYYKYLLKITYVIVLIFFIIKVLVINKKYNNPYYLFLLVLFLLFILLFAGDDIKYQSMFGIRPFIYLPTDYVNIQNIRKILKNTISTTINYFEIVIPDNVYSSI
jgi:membrane-associated HD superfamily phosphohydrolase